jgi:hypothetical protein
MIAFIVMIPLSSMASKTEINYNEQIVVTVQPDTKLKKAFKGIDLKKIKNLKIEDAPNANISLDFWDSYNVLKKMLALETLDVSDCKSLNAYLYSDYYKAQLPISTLVLRYTRKEKTSSAPRDYPESPGEAAIFFRDVYAPIYFGLDTNSYETHYPNLKELVLVGPGSDLKAPTNEEDELYANLDYGNSFVASFNPKVKIIRCKHLENLNRRYQILLDDSRSTWYSKEFTNRITPQNKQLEGVVVTDASFVQDLPKSTPSLTIPKTLLCILADGNIDNCSVDTLIVEESDDLLVINEHGLYGIRNVKNAIFNRPVYFNSEPGNGIFSNADKILFNKDAILDYANFGYAIKEIDFNGKAEIRSTRWLN